MAASEKRRAPFPGPALLFSDARKAGLQRWQRRQLLAQPLFRERVELSAELLVQNEHIDPLQQVYIALLHADEGWRFLDDELGLHAKVRIVG